MHQYTLIDPVTGEQTFLSDETLTRSLRQNCILLRDEEHIGIIAYQDLVAFIRWCAGEMLAKVKGTPAPETQHALTLVDRWLEDELNITSKELKAAAEASFTADAAAWAAWAAAWAAHGATAARDDADWAAQVAARAAQAAAGAARDAEGRGLSYESQAQWFVEHLKPGQ